MSEVNGVLPRRHGAVGKVLSCTETPAGTCQENRPDCRIRFDAVKSISQLLVHLHRETVQPIRAIEGDAPHPMLDAQNDGFVAHLTLPIFVALIN